MIFHETPRPFKSEVLSVGSKWARLSLPSLSAPARLSLLLHARSVAALCERLHWLNLCLQIKGQTRSPGPWDLCDLIPVCFSSLYFPLFPFPFSLLQPNRTLLGFSHLCAFAHAAPSAHEQPTFGPRVRLLPSPRSCVPLGVLPTILPQLRGHLCACLQVWSNCLISSPKLSGTKILFIFSISKRIWQYPAQMKNGTNLAGLLKASWQIVEKIWSGCG